MQDLLHAENPGEQSMIEEPQALWIGGCKQNIKVWQTASLQGLQALQTLQSCLTDLRKDTMIELPPMMAELLEQASSARFEAYCRNSMRAKPALMSDLSSSYAELRAAQETCSLAAASISHLADAVEQECKDILNQTSNRLAGEPAQEAGSALWDKALLVCSISEEMQKQTTLQAKILGGLPLDVSLEHLSNYVMVWELQPFIQSNFVALL